MGSLSKDQLRSRFHASRRNWNGLCQAGVRQACAWTGGAPTPNYLSANAAYHASRIVSHDASIAPAGSVHYWQIGKYGHVAGGLGGEHVFMCSSHVDTFWGINVGETTVSAYTRRTGAKYLGWALTNGHNKLNITLKAVKPARPATGRTKYTTALRGEGLSAIAARVKVSLPKIERLNPGIKPPQYIVGLGQKIRIS